jgi:hypothetical protein
MLSVKIYRNLRRNICYGIYFSKFHAICKGKFKKCDHIYLAIHSHSAGGFFLTPLSAVFQLRVECALFVIYKAGREPTPYWGYACTSC